MELKGQKTRPRSRNLRVVAVSALVSILLGVTSPAAAQQTAGPGISASPGNASFGNSSSTEPGQPSIFDTGKPWPGLRRVDADLAIRILHEQPGLMHRLPDGTKKIFWVKTATLQLVSGSPTESLVPGFPAYGPTDPSRWDLVLNGLVIDPREYEILYDERIFNLGALFTYREEFQEESQLSPWEIAD